MLEAHGITDENLIDDPYEFQKHFFQNFKENINSPVVLKKGKDVELIGRFGINVIEDDQLSSSLHTMDRNRVGGKGERTLLKIKNRKLKRPLLPENFVYMHAIRLEDGPNPIQKKITGKESNFFVVPSIFNSSRWALLEKAYARKFNEDREKYQKM
jgi:hypothetical protein